MENANGAVAAAGCQQALDVSAVSKIERKGEEQLSLGKDRGVDVSWSDGLESRIGC